jgi:glyoxylase-like metal-dependent hydrolase (beta-lactamase superfamily II)
MSRKSCKIALLLFFLLGFGLRGAVRAQTADSLPDYAPLLPRVAIMAPKIDPAKGYVVEALKTDDLVSPKYAVYMITEGAYESAFVTTGKGIVLFDAPPSFAQHISQAVAETTDEPIVELVYSHQHVDHIGGAGLILQQHPNIVILAEEGTAEFLREMNDPHRPVPTQTFSDHYTLKLGLLTADMKVGHWHCPEGDLLITIPDKKFVMAVDAFSAGATPFMGLDLTMNMHQYLKFFDQLEAKDFDALVAGHHGTPATKADLEVAKSYVTDVVNTMASILKENHQSLVESAVHKYGSDNKWAVASVLINSEVNECAQEIQTRWIDKLEGVDIWAASHCRTALVYDEWDVGQR